jgi:hypothetical protein
MVMMMMMMMMMMILRNMIMWIELFRIGLVSPLCPTRAKRVDA